MANELSVKVKNKKLSQKYLESFIEKTLAGTQMSLANLSRAADLISSFKMIAVDQSSDNLRTFPFNQYLNEILLSLQPQFKGLNHQITISCDEKIKVYGNAGAIAQIFTNLLMNTLVHGFENKDNGNINIEVNLCGDDIEFDYSDDGCGMSQKLLMKLFDPFFTTKRDNGGSGLGAHLIYNLVTQALHGRIVATSVMDEGLHFKIIFPRKAP
jgi:signal transduction histidine kinase